MRKGISFIYAVTLLLLACTDAFAASYQEVVKPKGFLILGGKQQWVSFIYDYIGHESDQFSSSWHRFTEKYHLSTFGAIMDPHLLQFGLEGDLFFEQGSTSTSSGRDTSENKFKFGYSFSGKAFDLSPCALTLNSSRTETQVDNTFSSPYTTTSTRNGITANIRNHMFPSRLRYQHTTLETSGLSRDSRIRTNTFSVEVANNYRNVSHTDGIVNFFSQTQDLEDGRGINSDSTNLTLSNTLYLDPLKRYSLGSRLSAQRSILDDIPQESLSLNETVQAQFGLALQGQASYDYDHYQTIGFDGREQTLDTQTGRAELTHWLAKSIESRLRGTVQQRDYLGGDEFYYEEGGSVNYRKKIPWQGEVNLGVNYTHSVTDRNLATTQLSVRDEQYPQVNQGDILTLKTGGRIVSVISVKSRNPEIIYSENVDFVVNEDFGIIEIVGGGGIPDGTDLFVSYVVEIDPSVKYATDAFGISGSVSVVRGAGKYQLLGSHQWEDNTILAGEESVGGLYEVRRSRVRFNADYPHQGFSLEYSSSTLGPSKFSFVEGGWYYRRNFARTSFSLQVRDRYSMYDAYSANRGGSDVNTFIVGGSYSRKVYSWGKFFLSMNYANNSGENVSNDSFYMRSGLLSQFNKLHLNLTGTTRLRMSDNQTLRDDTVHLEVTRFF